MSIQIAAWFTEKIKDKVTVQFQAHGGLLDGTMMSGDTQANTVKFPIIGRTEVYKLTGAIERVPVTGTGLTTVQLTMDDFEASDWWRVQDAYNAD
ncbi:phage capsid protein, partial [Mesorhizobium sp. M7A.T.Ca.TU.009.02.1.1]|uniref:phage capsid protein n=1 Tax=Mesorhizobium sp. M7A.T.Ca.TU.009.02.1.1 TaxID=2496791 RepID=UPI000FD3D521